MLLKVTLSFVLFLPALSAFRSASRRVTRPSSREYCHIFASPIPSPFLIYFSLWLSLVLLKVTISSHFASRHAYIVMLTRVTHLVVTSIVLFPPLSIPTYFAFSPTPFHSYLIWRISTQLDFVIRTHTYKAPLSHCLLFFVCSCIERTKRISRGLVVCVGGCIGDCWRWQE